MVKLLWIFLTVLTFIGDMGVKSVSFEEDIKITAQEAEILAKFKQKVLPKLPRKYMEESIFLIKWLRAKNFDVNQAENMLHKNLQWRKENRIDMIDEEDWLDFEIDFPVNQDGIDKSGRPMVQIALRDWDIRQAVIAGKRERLVRWVYKYFEDATKRIRKFQSEGKNVTQFTLLLDAEGFNPVNHGCPLCIPIYFSITSAYEEQFPGSVDKIHVVNTPEFFRFIIRLLWPLLSEATRTALTIHGTERSVWRRALQKDIKDSELLPTFGGTMNVI